jgi:hypothetical protein
LIRARKFILDKATVLAIFGHLNPYSTLRIATGYLSVQVIGNHLARFEI